MYLSMLTAGSCLLVFWLVVQILGELTRRDISTGPPLAVVENIQPWHRAGVTGAITRFGLTGVAGLTQLVMVITLVSPASDAFGRFLAVTEIVLAIWWAIHVRRLPLTPIGDCALPSSASGTDHRQHPGR